MHFKQGRTLSNSCSIPCRASSASLQHMSLKTGIIVVMGVDERGEPEFTQIVELLVDDGKRVILVVKAAVIVDCNEHFHSWVIRVCPSDHVGSTIIVA